MTREELFGLAERHVRQVWDNDQGPIGAGHLVLERYGIDREHAMDLCWQVAATSTAAGFGGEAALPALTALFMQGFIFALWLAEQAPATVADAARSDA